MVIQRRTEQRPGVLDAKLYANTMIWNFYNNGVHLVNKISRGYHSIVMYTLGLTRNLKFRWYLKKEQNKIAVKTSFWFKRGFEATQMVISWFYCQIMKNQRRLMTCSIKPNILQGFFEETVFLLDSFFVQWSERVFLPFLKQLVSGPQYMILFSKSPPNVGAKENVKKITETRTSELRKQKDVVLLCSILEKKML